MDQMYQVTLREKQNKLKDYMRDCEMMLGTEKLCEDNIQKLSNLLKTLDQVHKAIDAIQVGYTIIPDEKCLEEPDRNVLLPDADTEPLLPILTPTNKNVRQRALFLNF